MTRSIMPRLTLFAIAGVFLTSDCINPSPRHGMLRDAMNLPALRGKPMLVATPSFGLRQLLVDERIRGRDQRHIWLQLLAVLHPRIRLTLVLLMIIASITFWLRPGWSPQRCIMVTLPQIWNIPLCRAWLALGTAVGIVTSILAFTLYRLYIGIIEEQKDNALSEELLAAAASCAAYEGTVEHRLAELRRRGVESANWQVDADLSEETIAVFFNWHDQRVVVAFRGSASFEDWASNFRRIIPGDLESSPSFQHALDVTRAVQVRH